MLTCKNPDFEQCCVGTFFWVLRCVKGSIRTTVPNMTTDEHLLVSIVTLRILAWFCLHFAQSTVPVSAASTELLTC